MNYVYNQETPLHGGLSSSVAHYYLTSRTKVSFFVLSKYVCQNRDSGRSRSLVSLYIVKVFKFSDNNSSTALALTPDGEPCLPPPRYSYESPGEYRKNFVPHMLSKYLTEH